MGCRSILTFVEVSRPRYSPKVKGHIVWPGDGRGKDKRAKMESFLKRITKEMDICSYTDPQGGLVLWLVDVTKGQVEIIRREGGVRKVQGIGKMSWLLWNWSEEGMVVEV